MSPENFCYWLQGLLELQPDLKKLDEEQVQTIRDHLGYVFTHVQNAKALAPMPSVPTPFDLSQTVSSVARFDPLTQVSIC